MEYLCKTLILPFGQRWLGALCVAMEMSQWTFIISWNFALSTGITVQSFSFIQKKSSVNDNNDNNNSENKNNNMNKASFNTCHPFTIIYCNNYGTD